MDSALIVAVGSFIIMPLIYFAGIQRGRKERARDVDAQHLYERQQEAVREYIRLSDARIALGVYALARLRLTGLGTDRAIREAIAEMQKRTGRDPFGRDAAEVIDVDLMKFFEYVAAMEVNFAHTSVKEVADQFRGTRQ